MRIEDLCEGKRVVIKKYERDDIPEHWNEDGEMNEWMGKTVVISIIENDSGRIYIKEDGEHWCFYASDFYCQAFTDAERKNPNFIFSRAPIRR